MNKEDSIAHKIGYSIMMFAFFAPPLLWMLAVTADALIQSFIKLHG